MIVLVLLHITALVLAKKDPYSLREGPEHFEDFIDTHKKAYRSDEEKAIRYEIFLKNLEHINQLNSKYNYTEFGITRFTDLTLQEFIAKHTCFKASSDYFTSCRPTGKTNSIKYKSVGAPTQFDWRDQNVVTRVKDQGHCGACWAFSVIGNVESVNAIRTGQLVELSEQQLVDCDNADHGCSGGRPEYALEYLIANGAMSSTSYPYEGAGSSCRFQPGDVQVRVGDCVVVGGSGETYIAEQLASTGPLSIAIDSTPLRSYNGGVLTGEMCQYGQINHAVLLVGYGVDNESGLQYWVVKNSWGESFGEQGYFKMQRGVGCLGFTSYPPVSAVI